MRLIGILIISIIYALNAEELPKPTGFGEDLSALFDRDDSTLWVASDSLVSITVEPEGCFDRIVLVSSGEHERDVQRVVIHKDTASGWEITSNEVLPCSTDSSQEVRFKELVCADKVLLTFYSCTLQAVSLREMTFLNPLNQEKRALQVCATDAECATQIGLTCDGSNCVKTCISHPDCSDPLNPVCDFTTGNCAPGCATNQDCSHIPSAPYCNLDDTPPTCWANQCIPRNGNNDCINPDKPVCNSADGACISLCTSNNDCSTYPGKVYVCEVSTGKCKFSCRSSLDCDTGANNTSPPGDVLLGHCDTAAIPAQCVQCTSDDQCTHLFGGHAVCDPTLGCHYRECASHFDCEDPTLSQCSDGTCVACSSADHCAQFSVFRACQVYSGASRCVQPCANHFDCLYDGVTGLALPFAEASTASQCSGGGCIPCSGTDESCSIFSDVYMGHPLKCVGGAACAPVECLVDDDCTDPTKSVCDSNFTCVECANNDECAQFGFAIVCVPGQGCVNAPNSTFCVAHADCTLPETPVCVFGSCVAQCDIIPHACAQFFNETFCSSAPATAGQCLTPSCNHNEDCISTPATPICSSDGGNAPACHAECTTDTECQEWSQYDNPVCTGGACVPGECRLSVDCDDPLLPICNPLTFVCEATCTDNTQCTKFVDTRFCNTGICVFACRTDSDCLEPDYPFCTYGTTTLDGTGTIRGCSAACGSQANPCHQFYDNYMCDTTSGGCKAVSAGCAQDSDCMNPALPSCRAGAGGADECQVYMDCTSPDMKSGIIANRCFQFAEYTLCNPATGECVIPDCKVDYDCKNPALPLCDKGICVDDCTQTVDLCSRFDEHSFCRPTPDEVTGITSLHHS